MPWQMSTSNLISDTTSGGDYPTMKATCRRLNIKRLVQYIIHPIVRCSKPCRKLLCKISAYALLLAVIILGPYTLYNVYIQSVEMYFLQLHMDKQGTNVPSVCMVPDHNPYDPSILQYLFSWNPVKCGENQPYLTYVDYNGFIYLNLSAAKESGRSEQDYECTYSDILRCNGTDDEVQLSVEKIFRKKEKLTHPFVVARCILTSTSKLVHETGHAFVVEPSVNLIEKTSKVRPGRPSILIFGLDSMSRLNFIRQLPKTYKFLMSVLDSVVLSGLTKVGDNTYPNILTMLTGIAARKVDGVQAPYWGDEKANANFDDLPVAWKEYSNEGYITMYAEDLPQFTAFNYLAKGFLNEPTDYYMRPFWLQMDNLKNFRSSDYRCYGNIPKYTYLFNYTEEFITKMKDLPYFAFSFLTSYSHDHINSIQVIDDELEKMFQNMYRRGDLQNTIVIMMGDHGNRFDGIRQTVIGRVEERMPFFSVSLPPKLKKEYPHLQKGLEKNSQVLLSWFDVYELLMDVAKDNFKENSSVKQWGKIGYSPFRNVPRNRTCAQAGIPYNYCICAREKTLTPQEPAVVEVARDLVNHVNGLLSIVGEDKCVPLVLNEVTNAQLILPNAHVVQPKGFVATYRVTVKVEPSGGLLEGTLERNAWRTSGKVVGEVSRINRYGNQSHCIQDKILKLYCYCTDLLQTKLGV
ncbi:uncharacterized protein [Anabrus simplex]|uniref:uncharacterized protein n=1 Tax=Anabrus simplex TaxID=316456 RepID=UPI0035A2A486